MKISRLSSIDGAKKAEGLTIVIDIFRAATTEAYALSKGAKFVIPVSKVEEAFLLKKQNPEFLLMGEQDGIKINDFDFGNSPFELLDKDLKGKIIVHRSTRGTQGLVNARKAKEIIFGSFVTTSAIVRYAKKYGHEEISIVAMDPEDELFSDYLEKSLKGEKTDIEETKEKIFNHPYTQFYKDPDRLDFPIEDLNLVSDIDRFNFICLVKKEGVQLVTRKVDVVL